MSNLSVIIIAKNAQDKIVDAIESANFSSEVIIIDNESDDLTVDLSKKAGAKIIKNVVGTFEHLRNRGVKEAKSEWIFYLDHDERITSDLRDEIISVISGNDNITSYAIPRKNFIFGKEFKHGGEYPDYQKRLFLKSKLKKWEGSVHEQPVFVGELGYLKNAMIHLKHDNISDMIKKTNYWSEIEARLMYDSGHPPMNLLRFSTAIFREFWDRFIRKGGYKDGPEGIIYSSYQVFSRFTSYAKLWEMQVKNSK